MKRKNTGNGIKVSKCGKFATVKCGKGELRFGMRQGKVRGRNERSDF